MLFKKMQKKGQGLNIDTLLKVAMAFVILGMFIAFGSKIMADQQSEIETDYGTSSVAYIAINETLQAQQELAESQTSIVQVVVLGVILMILIWVYVLYRKNSSGM